MKIENFKNWSLNESQDFFDFSAINANKLRKLDIKFAIDFIDLYTSLFRLIEESTEDACIGDLLFRVIDLPEYEPETEIFSVLNYYYGDVVDFEDGSLDLDRKDDFIDFEEQNEKVNYEEAKKDIEKFLELNKFKSRTMVFLYELCYQIHNENEFPEELENCAWYNEIEVWELVKELIIASQTSFAKVIDMIPNWIEEANFKDFIFLLVTILPVNDDILHKYRGKITGKKFGL